MSMRKFAAVVFDLDGTLVDSRLDFAALRRELGFPEGIGILEHLPTLAAAERLAAEAIIDRHEMAGAAAARWIEGARELLDELHRRAIPTAIVTRNSRAAVNRTDAQLGLRVDQIVTREDCAPKPDPEGLLLIAGRLNQPPASMLYVGDFIYDLQAARRAGMVAALLLNDRNRHFRTQADLVVERLGDVLLVIE